MTIRRILLIISSAFLILCTCLPFNQEIKVSNEHLNIIIIKNIYIDDNFSIGEEEDIRKALIAWEKVSNYKIKFNSIYRKEEPGELDDYFNKKIYNNSIFIWRINNYMLSWYLRPRLKKYSGVYDRKANVVIFPDTINNIDTIFYNVVKHEIGHVLGLEHSTSGFRSTMKTNSNEISDCISNEDANKLCAIYFCKPNPECD